MLGATYLGEQYLGGVPFVRAAPTASFANAVGVADTITIIVVEADALANTVGIVDTIAAHVSPARAFANTVGVLDTVTRRVVDSRSFADTVGVSDTLSAHRFIVTNFTDTVGITDAIARHSTTVASFADTVGVVNGAFGPDGVLSGGLVTGAGGSGLIFSPHNSPAFLNDILDAHVLGREFYNSISATNNFVIGFAGDATFSRIDTYIFKTPGVRGAVPFSSTSYDTLVRIGVASSSPVPVALIAGQIPLAYILVPPNATDSSQCTITDARVFVSFSKGIRARTAADTVGVSDTLSGHGADTRTFSNTVGISEAISVSRSRHLTLSEGIGVTDTVNGIGSRAQNVTDTIGISETVTVRKTPVRTLTDTVGVSDVLTSRATGTRTFTDTVGIADVLAEHGTRTGAVSDTVGITDLFSTSRINVINLADTVAVADTVSRSDPKTRSFTNAVGITDTIARVGAITRSFSDAVGITDTLAGNRTYSKTVSDTVGIANVITGPLSGVILVSPTAATTDGIITAGGGNDMFFFGSAATVRTPAGTVFRHLIHTWLPNPGTGTDRFLSVWIVGPDPNPDNDPAGTSYEMNEGDAPFGGWAAGSYIKIAKILVPANATRSDQCTIIDQRNLIAEGVQTVLARTVTDVVDVSATVSSGNARSRSLTGTIGIADTVAVNITRHLIFTETVGVSGIEHTTLGSTLFNNVGIFENLAVTHPVTFRYVHNQVGVAGIVTAHLRIRRPPIVNPVSAFVVSSANRTLIRAADNAVTLEDDLNHVLLGSGTRVP